MFNFQDDLKKPHLPRGTARTPRHFIETLERDIIGAKFTIDVAASDDNHICDSYLTEKEDFITYKTDYSNQVIFLNPPYSETQKGYTIYNFVKRARDIRNNFPNVTVAIILESNMTSTKYFNSIIGSTERQRMKNHIDLYFHGRRVNFITNQARTRGYTNPKATMVVILHPRKSVNP